MDMTRAEYRKKLITFLSSRDCKLLATKPRQRRDVLMVVEAFFDQDSFTTYDVQALIARGTSYSYARKIINHLLRLKCITKLPSRQSRKTAYTFHAPTHKQRQLAPLENSKKITKTKDNKLRSNFSSQRRKVDKKTTPTQRKRSCKDVYEHCKDHPHLLTEPLKIDERYPFWRDIMRHLRLLFSHNKELSQNGASMFHAWLRKAKPTVQQALQILRIIKNYVAQGAIKTLRRLYYMIRYAVTYVMRRRVLQQAWYYLPPEKRKGKPRPKATYSSLRKKEIRGTQAIAETVKNILQPSTQSTMTKPEDNACISISDYYKHHYGHLPVYDSTDKAEEKNKYNYVSRTIRQRFEQVFSRPLTDDDIEQTRRVLVARRQEKEISNSAMPMKLICEHLMNTLIKVTGDDGQKKSGNI